MLANVLGQPPDVVTALATVILAGVALVSIIANGLLVAVSVRAANASRALAGAAKNQLEVLNRQLSVLSDQATVASAQNALLARQGEEAQQRYDEETEPRLNVVVDRDAVTATEARGHVSYVSGRATASDVQVWVNIRGSVLRWEGDTLSATEGTTAFTAKPLGYPITNEMLPCDPTSFLDLANDEMCVCLAWRKGEYGGKWICYRYRGSELVASPISGEWPWYFARRGRHTPDLPYVLIAVSKRGRLEPRRTDVTISVVEADRGPVLLETPTVLHESRSPQDFDFTLSGLDIVAVKKSATSDNLTECHILGASWNYRRWVLQTPTALPTCGAEYAFVANTSCVTAVHRGGTVSRMVELHTLAQRESGHLAFTGSLAPPIITGLPTTDRLESFIMRSNGDVVCFRTAEASPTLPEMFVLTAADNYRTPERHRVPVQDFCLDTWVLTGWEHDLVAVNTRNTSSGNTGVVVVASADTNPQLVRRVATAMPEADGDFVFFVCSVPSPIRGG